MLYFSVIIWNGHDGNESNLFNCSPNDHYCIIEVVKTDMMEYPPPPNTKLELERFQPSKNLKEKRFNLYGQYNQAKIIESMFKVNVEGQTVNFDYLYF